MLPAGCAVRFTVDALHTGPLFVGAAEGNAFTVTVVVYTVPEPQLVLLTVNE